MSHAAGSPETGTQSGRPWSEEMSGASRHEGGDGWGVGVGGQIGASQG